MAKVGVDASFRVLVVGVDGVTSVLLKEALGDQSFDVMCLSTDVAAYETLDREAGTLHALVVDTELGAGTTGFDVARYARRLDAALAVIFITGAHRDSVERFGVPRASHVAKPVDPDLLIMILREFAANYG